eukprot:GHVS01096626.1.p1 GENE.GHVS01096626.1~~GHVS01096626.1.p1  ORF type:complete len:114 (+),score=1.71 GHVS01096626.1:23-364(+)
MVMDAFEILVAEATLCYNSAPNASTGNSPYHHLFGMESRLPGLLDIRHGLRVAVEVQESLALLPIRDLRIGDIIVYHLTEWQQRREREESGHFQYTSAWSLPQIVISLARWRG